MALANDLLEQAQHLANKDGPDPSQASLRRAVSTAYYALFHLLIHEAVGNWAVDRHRNKLGRSFDHSSMRRVCEDRLRVIDGAGRPEHLALLAEVARTFVKLQEARHTADYDNSEIWIKGDAQELIDDVAEAFTFWDAIRSQDESQDFLFSLLFPKLART